MDIREIDKNFAEITTLGENDIVFYSIPQEPFSVYGVYEEEGHFVRLPEAVAAATNEGVHRLYTNTAGGRIRFVTDSPYIAIQVKYQSIQRSNHFTLCGTAGFDLYLKGEDGFQHFGTFRPPYEMQDGYESILYPKKGSCTYQINMPLYSSVEKMRIGIKQGSTLKKAEGYPNEKPVVFLGSSITQGGCASRPGMAYEEILSRRLNFNYVNLGFSGSCRAEDAMIEYIASLDMSCFVYDYDHNAPTPEYLEKTHEKGFLRIREKHPDLPIILMSAPQWDPSPYYARRREIVRATYQRAIARGDENVYFVDGETLLDLCRKDGTVDDIHPTDLGFFSMAQALTPIFEKIL